MRKNILIISTITVLIASIGVVSAVKSSNNSTNNKEEVAMQAEVNDPILPKTEQTAEIQETQSSSEPVQTSLPLDTSTSNTTSAPELPFDPKAYAHSKMDGYIAQGQSGMNWNCYENLITDSTNWNINASQIDLTFEKIRGQYPSTCAAYAAFKENGSY